MHTQTEHDTTTLSGLIGILTDILDDSGDIPVLIPVHAEGGYGFLDHIKLQQMNSESGPFLAATLETATKEGGQ